LLHAEEPFWSHRPESLGQLVVQHDGDAWTMALYCTTEDDARAGERTEMASEWQAVFAEQRQLTVGEPEFFDLQRPWLY
jgi:hypothetical protein